MDNPASGVGHLNCGVLAGESEVRTVCSQLSREMLGMVLQTSYEGAGGSSLGMLWIEMFSPVGRM